MQIERHFTLLIYPFRHAIRDDAADPRLRALDERWRHWWTRLSAKSLERALDDTYFFLPHIRKQLLFPEVLLLPNDPAAQAGKAQQLARGSVSELAGLLAEKGFRQSSVLRLTCDPSVREALHPLCLDTSTNESGDAATRFPMHVDWIDLVLFPQHVGFLVLKVRLDEPAPTADRLNDFLYLLRFVHRPTVDWRLPSWTRAEPLLHFEARDLVDFLLQGVAVESDLAGDSLEEFLERATSGDGARRYSLTEQGQVYGQTFRQYSYGCVSDPSPDATAAGAELERSGGPELFASPVQRALYELATCTQTADPDFAPHPRGLARTLEQGYIALWANWQAMALHDNVVFLGARASAFTRRTLPHNVEADYFHLYLLTLYQKIRLSFLSGELLRRDVDRVDDPEEARKLWDDYTRFRNHYWFVEVTSKPQGIALYRQFQRGLGVRALHAAVGAEVRELREYYESKTSSRIAKRQDRNIAIVARVQRMVEYIEIFLVSVYAAHLTDMLFATPPEKHPWGHLAVAAAAALGAIGTGWFVLRNKSESWLVLVLALVAFVAVAPFLVDPLPPWLKDPWNPVAIGWGALVLSGLGVLAWMIWRRRTKRRPGQRSKEKR